MRRASYGVQLSHAFFRIPVRTHVVHMEYLPVVLGRKRPFLEEICSASGESRSVCPRGRLLALVKSGGALAVYSLVGESIESVISFEPYTRSVHGVYSLHTIHQAFVFYIVTVFSGCVPARLPQSVWLMTLITVLTGSWWEWGEGEM